MFRIAVLTIFCLLMVTSAGLIVRYAAGGTPVGRQFALAAARADDADDRSDRSEEPKSRIVRALLDMLDEMDDEGTSEERRLIRRTLLDADEELHDSLGDNLEQKIRRANRKKKAFDVRRNRHSAKVKPKVQEPDAKQPDAKQPDGKAPVVVDPFDPNGDADEKEKDVESSNA